MGSLPIWHNAAPVEGGQLVFPAGRQRKCFAAKLFGCKDRSKTAHDLNI